MQVLFDKNGYYTGNYADYGNLKGWVEVECLPPENDHDKVICYHLEDNKWVFDEERYQFMLEERKVNIQLKDGTTLFLLPDEMSLYKSVEKLDRSIFTDENLSSVIIDGEKQGQMILDSFYDFEDVTHIGLRKPTEIEKLQAENTILQNALVDVYELLLSAV